MEKRTFGKIIAALFTMAFGMSGALADPVIRADLDRTSYMVGDLATVRVTVSGNTGMHGLFFDLGYDANLFSFVSLSEGDLPRSVAAVKTDAAHLLHAVSDPATSAVRGSHVIVSFAMNEAGALTAENGTLVEVVFRVISAPGNGSKPRFSFNAASSAAMGLASSKLGNTRFIGSSDITISAGTGAYVQINAPVDNQAVYEDTAALYVTSTAASNYSYVITNRDVGYTSKPISAQTGSLNGYRVPVSFGINRLRVELRKDQTVTMAYDEIVAFRSEDEVFVKIVSPIDHAMVNTDEVRVLATSPFSSVTINGQAAQLLGEKRDGKNLFASKVWLKKGFNVIVAQSVGPQDIVFTNSITVYYQRDDQLFKFLAPDADSVIKTIGSDPQLNKGSLKVRGEIGSDTQENGLPNRVTLRVIYTPMNPGISASVLVDNKEMTVSENTLGGVESEAPYVFTNSFSIPVADLDNGELELIAYKNKSGTKADAEIHRFVKLDRNKLAIDLIQPNVFGTDVLDSAQKFTAFNGASQVDWGNLVLGDNAAIGLAPVNCEIKNQAGLAGLSIESLIETKDGSRYALVNTSREMRIYRKGPEETTWGLPILKNSSMHGYALCETDVGLLVGVSNLSSSGNSGLYLFANGKLMNVVIGEPIAHVQFIEYRDGYAYIYGNGYSHLYSFNVFSLQETASNYKADVVVKIPCANDLFLKQFVLGEDVKTAFMLDNDGRLSVLQNLSGSGYEKVEFASSAVSSEASFAAVIPGTYRSGTYRAYLLVSRNGAANSQVLMENMATNWLIPSAGLATLAVADEQLIGATFADDRFALLYKKRTLDGFVYTIRKANILFNQVGFETTTLSEYPSLLDIAPGQGNAFAMLAGEDGSFTYGQNANLALPACYEFVRNFPASGEVRFEYKNPDAERIDGFSFYVDSAWLAENGIQLGFGAYTSGGGFVFGSTGFTASEPVPLSLPTFLDMKNDLVKVTHSYDADRGKELVKVTFTDPAAGRYLSFLVKLSAVAGRNRSISEFTVYKKKAVKLPRSGEATMVLPISGWVTDRTAHEIQIQEKTVALESNGYFLHFYELKTTQDTTTINLSCSNDSGERITMPFTVKIFDSVNEIKNVQLETSAGAMGPGGTEANEFTTDQELLTVSADVFGMEGCVAGYETYAYVTVNGTEKLELLSSGVFDFVGDTPIDAQYEKYGSGYVSGHIVKGPLTLYPGIQRLVLFVENPGGRRAEYTIGGKYPEVEYALPLDRQKILIQNSEVKPLGETVVVSGIAIDQAIDLTLRESASAPYVYTRKYTIKGRVNSITRFNDLQVKTNNRAVLFADGAQATTIAVDQLNRFEVDVYITLSEDVDSAKYAVLFIPTTPYLAPMKTGVILEAEKDYTGAYIVPSFSPMDAANWSTSELTSGAKAVRVRFTRHVPTGASLSLLVNFETAITGTLAEDGVGTKLYKLLDQDRKEVCLTGMKNGMNRVQWTLSRNTTISSSSYSRAGMDDYTLELHLLNTYTATDIVFNVDQKTYYAAPLSGLPRVALPSLQFQKHLSTAFAVKLNGETLYVDEGTEAGSIDPSTSAALRQGRNELVAEYTEKDSAPQTRSFVFMYDSEVPTVRIADYRYVRSGDSQYLSSLSAIVQEANIFEVELIERNETRDSEVGTSGYTVSSIGNDTYELRWNKLDQNDPLLNPTPAKVLFVRITDHAGNIEVSPLFEGMAKLPPVEETSIYPIPIGDRYDNVPTFEEEASHWGATNFPTRLKAYSADMEYPSLDISASDGNYTINRSGNVRLGTVIDSTRSKTVTVNAGGSVKFARGFSLPRGTTLKVRKPAVDVFNPVSSMLRFQNAAAMGQFGVSFWLRIETEGAYAKDSSYKKILTIAQGTDGDVDYEVYLAYRDNIHGSTGDETLALIERQKLRGSTEAGDDRKVVLLGEGTDQTLLSRSGSAGWNLVTVSVDVGSDNNGISPFYRLSVNDNQPVQGMHSALSNGRNMLVDVTGEDLCLAILDVDSEHDFGCTNGSLSSQDNTQENGHFSIARPFYVNKSITNKDVAAMADRIATAFAAINDTSELPNVDMALRYDFTRTSDLGPLSTAGTGFEQLRMVGPIDSYHAPQEDALYGKPEAIGAVGGSLRASALRVNRIKASADGFPVFRDAAKYLTDGLRATSGINENAEWIILEPASAILAGRYAFANNYTSHTLMNVECYSIYGKVAPFIPGTVMDAVLVVSINGIVQRYRFEEGDFHFDFRNPDGITPSRVSMFLETKTPIKLGKNFFFTEGNFRLPDEAFASLPATCATTKNIFQKTGTIEFWYKPMIADKDGFVDYNVTLFDSELVQISSEIVGGHAVLVASVKKNGSTPMRSAAPLLAGWQHIQFSWSRATGSHLACLYLNGQIVSKLQGTDVLPLSPSMEGTAPVKDNVTIGANMAQTQYANGYLDEVRIDNVYDEARYVPRQPITASYTDGFDSVGDPHPDLAIGKRDSLSQVEEFSLVLLDASGKMVYENKQEFADAPGLDIRRFNAGIYTLLMKAKVNGYRFTHTYRFMKNDRPRFISKDCTGIVVNGEETDLRFEFQYDTSYRQKDDLLNRLAGLEFIVHSNDKGTAQTRRYVVFQKWNDPHTELGWFKADAANFSYDEPLVVENNEFAIAIDDVVTTEAVDWSFRPFYFEGQLNLQAPLPAGAVTDDCRGTIPFASFSVTKLPLVPSKVDPEYKIEVRLDNMSLTDPEFIKAFTVEYVVRSKLTGATSQSEAPANFSRNGELFLYYDDMLSVLGYGEYEAYFTLRYDQREIRAVAMTLNWQASKWDDKMPTTERRLSITEFSLLQIQAGETSDTANLYLEYDHSGLFEGMDANVDSVDILYDLTVLKKNVNGSYSKTYERTAVPITDAFQGYAVIQGVPISKSDSIVKISVYDLTVSSGGSYSSLVSKAELPVVNRIDPPQVFLTNSVPSRIGYNNVKFSWTGYYHNEFRSDIKYSYNLDDKGWSSVNAEWRSVEYFNLGEGSHKFAVRAHFGSDDNTSPEVVSMFFIDVSRPVIDSSGSKITVERVKDSEGFTYAVNLRGAAGAIVDSSLSYVLVNGASVELNRKDGSFVASGLPVTVDGINKYVISAYDLVGNRTEKTIEVDNTITELLYPADGSKIRYTPITVVGRIPQTINQKVEIYVRDPLTKQGSANEHSGWHKARMNEDYTFFVEDVTLTPGTYDREAHTVLELAVVTRSGHAYTKEIDVSANEVERPIDLALSLHAAEGERAETKVTLSAVAKVANISSWSVDFTGDGIYDDVVIMDDAEHSQSYSWTHTYSALGVFKPRVRVITKAGVYFSVDDTLTIHEKIKEASNKMVANPLSLDALTMADGTQRLYALAGKDGSRIEVYEIGRNESYVSNKLYEVPLTGVGIKAPVRVCAVNGVTILVAENLDGAGILHTLVANEFEQYDTVASARLVLTDGISDVDCDGENVFITLQNSGVIVTAAFVNGKPDPASMVSRTVATLDGKPLGGKMGISKDEYGILLSDYYHQRIVRLTNAFTPLEYVGEQGEGEGQFIKPSFVRSHQNRLFVYDEGRGDVQFFDPQFKPITRLVYNPSDATGNYLDAAFLNDVVGISVFTRTESEKLFYYAVLLSRTSGKLSVIRMPQWEEMRATVRNNKIIFLKDNEVYAAKPSGSDLTHLISSDSIPRINGSADYPALSPDGRMIAFTSRAKLLDGSGETASGTTYAYDNLYVMNVDGSGLQRIPLADIARYEIERPQFNSNGTALAFSAKLTGGNWQLYTYTFATGGVVNLLKSKENARFPYFSPDDRFIVFSTDYDGDEEIQIYDTLNPTMRVSVTNNASRDSFPVWNTVYLEEIANPDAKIESKIAFVSERNSHKGVYYAYVSRKSEADVRIVTRAGQETGSKPDAAAIELTKTGTEGDYPCFTGDGTKIVYENYDGFADELIAYDYPLKATSRIDLLRGSRRPAGMKNAIARFSAEVMDGNSIALNWSRYTDADVFYTVRFRESLDGAKEVEKRVFTQDAALLTGLEMGMDYLVRVSIEENGEEAASTQWKKVHMPEVVARPSYKIDADNPYIVHLYAWTPNDKVDWGYTWIIDNQELASQSSGYMNYQFSTSGIKSIALKVRNKANTYSDTSKPMAVPIVSDIVPVITYLLDKEKGTIQLSPDNSLGKNIDYSSILWTVTGAGSATPLTATVRHPVLDISAFRNKVNVSLRLSRIYVNNQANTDTLESNVPVDLYYKGTKLVITQEANAANKRLIAFSGAQSIGNFEWRESQWYVFRNGTTVFQTSGSSSFAYEFPERDEEATYSVSLTVLSKNSGQNHTATNLVTIKSVPIEPEIDYEIVTMKDPSNAVVGAKIIFSATNSKGNDIDFTQAKWTVPVAASYGDEPVQVGPTAVYNLFNAGSVSQVEVTLSLMRKGETKPVMLTKTINIEGNQVAKPKLVVKTDTRTAESGSVIEMNILSSTGANIDWEKTSWQVSTAIDGQTQNAVQQGPAARILVGASAQKVKVRYTVTLYFYGATKPLVSSGEVEVGAKIIKPVIGVEQVSGGAGNVYNFSVAETAGANIDWDRTTWYFYDGNTVVTQKNGAIVTHAFTRKNKATGYPVVAVMYFKNGSSPFYGYKSVDIDADEFVPVISWDRAEAIAASEILFSSSGSLGSNIDWSQAKWNFGDGSAPQYGAAASHQYPISSTSKEYRVSLTLTRTLPNGEAETATSSTVVNASRDVVKPVVMAKLYRDGYLVLSSEESEGRGLLLNQSAWMFAGKGDSSSINISKGSETSSGTTSTQGWEVGGSSTTEFEFGGFAKIQESITVSGGRSWSNSDSSSSSDSLNSTDAFSNENYHIGMTARRWIGDYDIYAARYDTQKTITVSLNVYRQDADGGMVGKTITVNINLADAVNGVSYR